MEGSKAPTSLEIATLSATIKHLDALYRNFYVTPPVDRRPNIAAMMSRTAKDPSSKESIAARLTPREKAVGWLLVQGRSPKAVSEALDISRATVYKHIEHMHSKLGASNQTEPIHILPEVFLGND